MGPDGCWNAGHQSTMWVWRRNKGRKWHIFQQEVFQDVPPTLPLVGQWPERGHVVTRSWKGGSEVQSLARHSTTLKPNREPPLQELGKVDLELALVVSVTSTVILAWFWGGQIGHTHRNVNYWYYLNQKFFFLNPFNIFTVTYTHNCSRVLFLIPKTCKQSKCPSIARKSLSSQFIWMLCSYEKRRGGDYDY